MWLKVTRLGHGRAGAWLQNSYLPPAYTHLNRTSSGPEISPSPFNTDLTGSRPLASAAGHFLQHLWRSRAKVYTQVLVSSDLLPALVYGAIRPLYSSADAVLKSICWFDCLCENFQTRFIHFLSSAFFLIPWNDISSCTLNIWTWKLSGPWKSIGQLTVEIISSFY